MLHTSPGHIFIQDLLFYNAPYQPLRQQIGRELRSLIADRGIVMCSSEGHVGDALDVLAQIRTVWNSTIPVSIAHCNELSEQSRKLFLKNQYVSVLDICKIKMDVFSSIREQEGRLRGYFCKPAALIQSPFNETLIIDADTIWFEKPELLFDSWGYIKTGALFFRDRFITEDGIRRFYHDVKRIVEKETGQDITRALASEMFKQNGISYFWAHAADPRKPALRHAQDSSALLVHRDRHSGFLAVLERLIPSFAIGYGDKEIYWIAATISREVFSWEPFLVGSYGDCGASLHYDPRMMTNNDNGSNDEPSPFYMNAEYMIECAVEVGQDLEEVISGPVLAREDTEIFNLGTKYHPYTGGVCGVCSMTGCVNSTVEEVNRAIKAAQAIRVRNGRKPISRCENKIEHGTSFEKNKKLLMRSPEMRKGHMGGKHNRHKQTPGVAGQPKGRMNPEAE
eukprot:gene1110-2157_t